jgi:hypothetical protein
MNMNAPTIYIAHPITREFLGTAFADPDPLDESNWLIPADAYLDEPMAAIDGHAVRRTDDAWELIEDHRGTLFDTGTGEAVQFDQLGPLPESLTDQPFPGPFHRWSGAAWALDADAQREGLALEAVTRRDAELQVAIVRIAPLQDAVDLDDATAAEVAELKAWKQYRVALNRIEQQAGYPATIDWPVSPAPTEGIQQ